MIKFDIEREANIAKAIKYYDETLGIKKSKVVTKFHVPYRLFKVCFEGRLVQNTKKGTNKTLNTNQEDVLRLYINFLIYYEYQANKIHIKLIVNSILYTINSMCQLNIQWTY